MVEYHELNSNVPAESSAQIKERVAHARLRQEERLGYNAQMSHKQVRKFCALEKEENELLKTAMSQFHLSARAFDKILKVSRTISDLAGSEDIRADHIAEAIQYRSLDRSTFA